MERAHETEVAAPTAPSNLTPRPATAVAEPVAEARPTWHWCPGCKLAASKPGNCPGCTKPYVAAAEAGVPDTAYAPNIPAGRSVRAVVASAVGVVLLLAAAAGTIVLLASHGSATDSTSGMSGSAASSGSHLDGVSTYGIAPLHGTLRLQGNWGTSMQQMSLNSMVTAGAKVKGELSVGKGGDVITIASFPSPDPSGVLNQMVSTASQTGDDAMGNKLTNHPTRDVTIAGYTGLAQDFETRNAKGGLLNRGTLYWVNAGDQVVVIRASVLAAQSGELSGLEQALVAIG